MKKASDRRSASTHVQPEVWNQATAALNKLLEQHLQVNRALEKAASPYQEEDFNEVFQWWERCLDDFDKGLHLIDPSMPKALWAQMRLKLQSIRTIYELISVASDDSINQLLLLANKALEKEGSHFIIPIVYLSQKSGKQDAFLAEFTREKNKLTVVLLTRGEGMRVHPLLKIRNRKRLYSYCSEQMELRDQQLFSKKPSALAQAWIKQLKGFQILSTTPEEIFAVFADVLGGLMAPDFMPEMAHTPARSASSLAQLPHILFKRHSNLSPEELKRLIFSVKIQALFQVLRHSRAGLKLDPSFLQHKIAQIHNSAAKLAQSQNLIDKDLALLHLLTETLENELPAPELVQSVSSDCQDARTTWQFKAPIPYPLLEDSGYAYQTKLKAKKINNPGELHPDPHELLDRLKTLAEVHHEHQIVEIYALITHLPLPKLEGPDEYWDAINAEDRPELLEALRKLLQSYGKTIRNSQETELPRAILCVASAYCIADSLARRLKDDPLKLKGFGLDFSSTDKRFFFHRREQCERWREIKNYFLARNKGVDKKIFGYYRGEHPWGILKLERNKSFYFKSEQHLLYLQQFDSELPLTELLARRYLYNNQVIDGLKMPSAYDNLHYFSVTLDLLTEVLTDNTNEDLSEILCCDQIPVLLRYTKNKEEKYKLIFQYAAHLPKNLDRLLEQKQRISEAPVQLQTRQSQSYSEKAQTVFFPKKLKTENQIMHAEASLDQLPQAAIHAIQRIMLQKVYRLRLSQLMDFCFRFPLACRHPDVRLLIEHVLLQEGALYTEFRDKEGAQRQHQIHTFLRSQRERTASSESGFEDHLLWQRLTLDVEQLAPEGPSHIEELLTELESSTKKLRLNEKQQAALALHRSYLYSFTTDQKPPSGQQPIKANQEAELLRYWMEARTLRRKLNNKNMHWMEGEIQRHIELHAKKFQAAIPEALERLATFLPDCDEWTENEGLYTCHRGPDRIVVDPLEGHIYCNDKPLGSSADQPPNSLCDSVNFYLGVNRTPTLKQGADQVWTLESDPSLRFEHRKRNDPRIINSVRPGALGMKEFGHLYFYQAEDEWRIPPDIRKLGKRFYCQTSGPRLMIEEDNGELLIIFDKEDHYSRKKETYGKYTNTQGTNFEQRKCEIEKEKLSEIRDKVIEVYERQIKYLAIREFTLEEKTTSWQRALHNGNIPPVLLREHTAWIECDSEKPRLLLLDVKQNPSILLTPSDQGFVIVNLKTSAERVAMTVEPWTRLDKPESIIAWAKNGRLEEIYYPYLEGLRFIRKDHQFECAQFPGFLVQIETATELPGFRTQLLLKNALDQCRLLIPSANKCLIYEKNKAGGRWKISHHSSAFYLMLLMLSCAQPLAAFSILDQISDEEPLTLEDWKQLAKLSQQTKMAHGVHAMVLQLALRITEVQDEADIKASLPLKMAFWEAVDQHLTEYGQDQNVPFCLQLSEAQIEIVKSYPRPEKAVEKSLAQPMRTFTLHHAVTYLPMGYHGTKRPEFCGHWSKTELGGNFSELAKEAIIQKDFPAPIDLQLRATLVRARLGLWSGYEGDLMRLNLLKELRSKRKELSEADLKRLDSLGGTEIFYARFQPSLRHKPLIITTKETPAHQLSPIRLEFQNDSKRPFSDLFNQLVTVENKALPEEAKDLDSIVSASDEPLCETVQNPIRQNLKKPTKTEVGCYTLADNAKNTITEALCDLRQKQQAKKKVVEEIANRCRSLVQQSVLLSPKHPSISAEEILLLFNPENPRTLIERNPFLNEEDLKELMAAAIDYMECGWKISQLDEALAELEVNNRDNCAAILDKVQTFSPYSDWWLCLYQYMSGNLLRSDPDQATILKKIFHCLDSGQTDMQSGELQQLYFEFPAGGGKTKVISAITALRCLSMGKTPIFFSFPNLVDICQRDLKTALTNYFQVNCEYLNLSLSSQLSDEDLQQLLERFQRLSNRPRALVMIPEGYQLLVLEYHKALSSKNTTRVTQLDQILLFFEENAVFLIDEGHRNKDSLLNSNIAIGQPQGIPAVYRAFQNEVYRWLAKHPTLGLQQNAQASLSPSTRTQIIRELLQHMLSLKILNVDATERVKLIDNYLMDKSTAPPAWLLERFNSQNKQQQLQAQWIAQLRGLATEVLPFTLSLKGMIDHGPSIHPSNEVEAPRDHGQLSGSKFEVPDIALGLTHQGFLQRGLKNEEQFIQVLKELKQQSEIQGDEFEQGNTPIEQHFLEWQRHNGSPLREIDVNKPDSRTFQEAYQALRTHLEIILRYVAAVPAAQVAVYNHRLLATAAGLSYGAAQAIVFSATLGMRTQYTYFGDDHSYCEDTDFLTKVIRKACLQKNARVELDHSTTPDEFIKQHQLDNVEGFLDFGGACGVRPSYEWSRLFLEKNKNIDGTVYAKQQVDSNGKIGEKVLFLHLRDQHPRQLEGSDLKSLLRKPEFRGKRLIRIFGPDDTIGMDMHAGSGAEFVITIGENCCLDDLAQTLLRARLFLLDVPEEIESQTIRWIVHEKIAHQIREALGLQKDTEITPKYILRWALLNMVKRLREAIQARAYQEIEGVYMRLLRITLRGQAALKQQEIFKKCENTVYKKMGYNPFKQWGFGCQQKATREVLSAFNQSLKESFMLVLNMLPAWADARIEEVIVETENLIKLIPSHRSNDLNARQLQKQEVRTQQRQRMQKKQQQRMAAHHETARTESTVVSDDLSIEKLQLPLNHPYFRTASELLQSDLLPKNFYLTQDSLLTQDANTPEGLWKLDCAKPFEFLLVLREENQEPVYLGLSQPQASAYMRQLLNGKKSNTLDIGLLDIQGQWPFSMQNPPSEEEYLPYLQATCLIDGRLQHVDHLLKLAEQNAKDLEKLWTQLHKLHLDPIPSWERVLTYTTDQDNLLDATANSTETLEITVPKGPPGI